MKWIPVLSAVICLGGCESAPLQGQAQIYRAINEALIEHGACASVADCEANEIVFSESGRGRINFSVFSAADPRLREGVEDAVKRAKHTYRVPYPIKISFHTESHRQSLQGLLPARASYIKEIE
jgi:hypothetical protein